MRRRTIKEGGIGGTLERTEGSGHPVRSVVRVVAAGGTQALGEEVLVD